MLNRAVIVDEQFTASIHNHQLPSPASHTHFEQADLDKQQAIQLFDTQIKSRLLDIIARELKEKGLSFYTIGSSGHEGNAGGGLELSLKDMAFLHYRSCAFYIQRARHLETVDGLNDCILSFLASAEDPISGGRHKVFGRKELNIPPQTSTIASHLPKALGLAVSLSRGKNAGFETDLASDAISYVSFGDGSVNHASSQTTLNACSWLATQGIPLPLVFWCEDNGTSISVPTPTTWIEASIAKRPGIHYFTCDGLNIADVVKTARQAFHLARSKKVPVFVRMRCVRLLGHAGSDIELQYNTLEQIERTEKQDPLLHTARMLLEAGWMNEQAILTLYKDNRALIEAKATAALKTKKLDSAEQIASTVIPDATYYRSSPGMPDEASRQAIFAEQANQLKLKRNLCQQINFALTDLMLRYPQIVIFGEDVGKKGGVYRVTADLQKRFGPRRVFDTLLDETTILGTAIGFAHNGFIPIPEIQFLAYLHNAEDQLRGEASTLSFFSKGQYQNPMVIRIASWAYQKGFGGHFHNDNAIGVLRDLPGVIVATPSHGEDAAKMLRTCVKLAHEQRRVVVFLEPIALYMTKDLHEAGDNLWLSEYPDPSEMIELGDISEHGKGDIAILSFANGYYLSRQAAAILESQHQIQTKVIDIRWLNPLPIEAILQAVRGAKHIVIVDESRKSGSVSEGIWTLLQENSSRPLSISRITASDCFIPLGDAWQHVLPSRDAIVNHVASILKSQEKSRGRFIVN
jgi:2-oxoisovalerate dehydrogenase E1 component